MSAMLVGVWNFYETLNHRNFLFHHRNAPIGDDLLLPFNRLYERASLEGSCLETLDMVSNFDAVDAFLFIDYPDMKHPLVQRAMAAKAKKHLILFENEVVKPDNWRGENHAPFHRIYTWHDAWVDDARYVKLNYAQDLDASKALLTGREDRRKFLTLIASAKLVNHPLSLYGARLRIIEWFAKHHPEQFDLYGVGWPHGYPCYRGAVGTKRKALTRYRFSICFENAHSIPGYITEKLFDALIAGCIPVYWGAPNIDRYVPAECFIDARNFDSFEGLYERLALMPRDEEEWMRHSIARYLESPAARAFGTDQFVLTLLTGLRG